MKTHSRNPFLLPALIAGLVLTIAGKLSGQTFTTLHSFTALNNSTNSDGANPRARLILSGNTLYGTAQQGGSYGSGVVFAINTDGTSFTNFYSFTGGSDGANPDADLITNSLGNILYGTAYAGGDSGYGTMFKVNSNGTGFTNLHSFTAVSCFGCPNDDGAYPIAGVVLSGNTLYGTAAYGGSSGFGTVFKLNAAGGGFMNISLAGGGDGANPVAGVILSGNTAYGILYSGGSSGNGAVFAVHTDGSGFTNLHSFTAASDGANPYAGLIRSGNILYGTTRYGGNSGNGTVFAVKTDGTGFTNLHSFISASDGANPRAGLVLLGNTLYGTASLGGGTGNGTVFAVNTDGTGFKTLHSFSRGTGGVDPVNSDGAFPIAGLLLSGNTLYGTTYYGGNSGNGTVFSLSVPVAQLTIIRSEDNVVLTWPANDPMFDYTGFNLQSTTDSGSAAVWDTNSPEPFVIDGQNVIINPISSPQQFYRLSK